MFSTQPMHSALTALDRAPGNVNGDGLADVIVHTGGGVWLVLGKRDTSPVALRRPSPSHLLLVGRGSVDAVGDVTSGGVDDLVTFAPAPVGTLLTVLLDRSDPNTIGVGPGNRFTSIYFPRRVDVGATLLATRTRTESPI